jgi:ABC-2 type transport system permease protein
MTAVLKRDFRAYFTSPIGYIYIGAYVFVLNLVFYLENGLNQSASLANVFSFMLIVMMFTTPILTMRVFSEEYKQRTDQLLLTTPVRTFDIVLGKFLSAQLVFMTLLALTFTWPLTIAILGENNAAEVFGNYAGIFFIGAAYIAMGIFISSLTENQVVAAVGSLGLFLSLFLVDTLSSFFFTSGALPIWIMSILNYISIMGRFHSVTSGILALSDVIFFISVCALFLFLTARRWDRQRGFSIIIISIFIAGLVLVNVLATQLTNRFYLKADLTEHGIYTLSEETVQILSGMDEDVVLTILAEETTWQNDTRSRLVETLRLYHSHSGGRITLNYLNPTLNPRIIEQYPALAELREGDIIVESPRRYTSVGWRDLFDWEINFTTGSNMPVALNAEQSLTSALLYALSDITPRAVFLEGHDETPSDALQALFEKANYQVQTLNLAHNELPEDTAILVSVGPSSDFLEVEMERLETYMRSGGNAIILYDISTPSLPRLDLYLEEWGIAVEDELVLDSQFNYGALFSIAAVVLDSAVLPPDVLPSVGSIDTDGKYAHMAGARVMSALWPTGERHQRTSHPLMASMPSSSYSKHFASLFESPERTSDDKGGPFILAMIASETIRDINNLHTGLTSHLLVSSACLVDGSAIDRSSSFLNAPLLGAIVNDFNPAGVSVIIPGKALGGSSMPVLAGHARTILIVLVIVMPVLILISGVLVWRRRRSL